MPVRELALKRAGGSFSPAGRALAGHIAGGGGATSPAAASCSSASVIAWFRKGASWTEVRMSAAITANRDLDILLRQRGDAPRVHSFGENEGGDRRAPCGSADRLASERALYRLVAHSARQSGRRQLKRKNLRTYRRLPIPPIVLDTVWLTRLQVLFFIEVGSRRVHLARTTWVASGVPWMIGGALAGRRFVSIVGGCPRLSLVLN